MRDFSIDLIWTKVQIAITAIGGWLGYFLGGMDGLMVALIVLMTLDYISGVMCAIIDKKLSSAVGFKGICKKVFILMLVGVAHIIDLHVVGTGSALRSAVVCFYLSNEGLSLLENAARAAIQPPAFVAYARSGNFAITSAQRGQRPSAFAAVECFQQRGHFVPAASSAEAFTPSPTATST